MKKKLIALTSLISCCHGYPKLMAGCRVWGFRGKLTNNEYQRRLLTMSGAGEKLCENLRAAVERIYERPETINRASLFGLYR